MILGLDFVWDERKNQINIKKHGVSFQTAALVFGDDYRIEILDRAHSREEERFINVGMAGDSLIVLYVVYTERENKIRLISARKASKTEREMYYAGRDYN